METIRLFVPTPNSKAEVGYQQDTLLLNTGPSADALCYFKFLGILMGVAIRSHKPLNLHLAPFVWKQIAGMQVDMTDIEEVTFFLKLYS